MGGSFQYSSLRRLPVFFLLDISEGMIGTFEVTMRQGLQVVKNELSQHSLAAQCVHVGGVTFNEKATFHHLTALSLFISPEWEAKGRCVLKPAFDLLMESLTYDLIVSRPERPGDYAPMVFLILGSKPTDAWREGYGALATFNDNRRPLIVTLVTQIALVKEALAISQHVLLLNPAWGEHMTNFFYWVAQVIAKVCENCEQGANTIDFPGLPYGVVMQH